MDTPGSTSESPLSSIRIFFNIWRTIISTCLSLISTPCKRYTRCTSLDHVILHGAHALDLKDIVGVHATFGQLVAGLKHLSVQHL